MSRAHRRGFLGEAQAHKPAEHLNNAKQLVPICRGVHRNENVRQAVDGVHIAARRHPYHFSEGLRDGSGDKVYLVLVDLTGRFNECLFDLSFVKMIFYKLVVKCFLICQLYSVF